MHLAGLQKLTLLDYPGEIACTVFTQGCNLRCPFCQNPDLVLPKLAQREDLEWGAGLSEEDFFDFLERRRGRLSAVAVTGGEPTLHADLPQFLGRIREMGYLVKLDTNGLNPEALRKILDASLVDYVAMDVKNSPGKYALTCGLLPQGNDALTSDMLLHVNDAVPSGEENAAVNRSLELWERARESISMLMNGKADYEFRTTVVHGLHTLEDMKEIAQQLQGARAWYLQRFEARGDLVGTFTNPNLVLSSPSQEELEKMREQASKWVPEVSLRGV